MKPAVLKPFLFRLIMLAIVLIALEIIGYAGLWLNSQSVDYLANKHYFNLQAMLAGRPPANLRPRFLTLPYLGYVPYPGYYKNNILQHNSDGYRGHSVPLQKNGQLRILCLGGSTTYGFAVDSPTQAFPAVLQQLLQEHLQQDSTLGKKYSGVEVINAGLDAGTSAEELQQYLFKYRYYRPDIVLVHSGINDAQITSGTPANFQLDYTHYRRINYHLEPLPKPARWLMHSNFCSYLIIRLFFSDFSALRDEFRRQTEQTYCHWTSLQIDSVINHGQYQYYPFYQNTRSLFQQIVSDSAQLILLPNILNQQNEQVKNSVRYVQLSELNNNLSDSLCRQLGGVVIPFTYHHITNPQTWVDDCHLNAQGEKQKAEYIFTYFKSILKNRL